MGRNKPSRSITRRMLLQTSAGAAGMLGLELPAATPARAQAPPAAATPATAASVAAQGAPPVVGPGPVELTLRVNGADHPLSVEPAVTLLDALRERIGLTGTKKGCDRGECGACTVLVDGQRVTSCLTLAIMREGQEITTIEGLAEGDRLHPLQTAFVKHDAFQCGFCTSGQIVSAVALLAEGHTSADDEIREWMNGNLCRCSAYPNILAAIREVAGGGAR